MTFSRAFEGQQLGAVQMVALAQGFPEVAVSICLQTELGPKINSQKSTATWLLLDEQPGSLSVSFPTGYPGKC